MVTGNSLIPKTQEPSQGAGQILPVNSGKGLVVLKISYAFFHSSLYTASLNSGITFPSGQPLIQKGIPQFIHLADCLFNNSADGKC